MATIGIYAIFFDNPTPYTEITKILKALMIQLDDTEYSMLHIHYSKTDESKIDVKLLGYDTKNDKNAKQIEGDIKALIEFFGTWDNINYLNFEYNR